MTDKTPQSQSVLGSMPPAQAIVKLAIPATLALLAKAVYNIVDTAYIGMLRSDLALTAVGVTIPLLLIMVSIENIFAAGAAVLAGRQLGAKDERGASRTVTTVIGLSVMVGVALCVGGILCMEPLLRGFGASDEALPLAKDYALWMFVAALANLLDGQWLWFDATADRGSTLEFGLRHFAVEELDSTQYRWDQTQVELLL